LIDLEVDVIDEIRFAHADGREGWLRFGYLQEIDRGSYLERAPEVSTGSAGDKMLWLIRLAESVK